MNYLPTHRSWSLQLPVSDHHSWFLLLILPEILTSPEGFLYCIREWREKKRGALMARPQRIIAVLEEKAEVPTFLPGSGFQFWHWHLCWWLSISFCKHDVGVCLNLHCQGSALPHLHSSAGRGERGQGTGMHCAACLLPHLLGSSMCFCKMLQELWVGAGRCWRDSISVLQVSLPNCNSRCRKT